MKDPLLGKNGEPRRYNKRQSFNLNLRENIREIRSTIQGMRSSQNSNVNQATQFSEPVAKQEDLSRDTRNEGSDKVRITAQRCGLRKEPNGVADEKLFGYENEIYDVVQYSRDGGWVLVQHEQGKFWVRVSNTDSI